MRKTYRRWTEFEMLLLGEFTDAHVAKFTGRSKACVRAQRRAHRIRAATTHTRQWTRREIRLLGTMTDKDLAEKLRCSRLTVSRLRLAMEIPAFVKQNRKRNRRVNAASYVARRTKKSTGATTTNSGAK